MWLKLHEQKHNTRQKGGENCILLSAGAFPPWGRECHFWCYTPRHEKLESPSRAQWPEWWNVWKYVTPSGRETGIICSYWFLKVTRCLFFSLLSYFPRAVLGKEISDSVSDMESQRNRPQLSLRKNLPTVASASEMSSHLSSEKASQGGNQETLKDAGLHNFWCS